MPVYEVQLSEVCVPEPSDRSDFWRLGHVHLTLDILLPSDSDGVQTFTQAMQRFRVGLLAFMDRRHPPRGDEESDTV
jgi:hypothetical protein